MTNKQPSKKELVLQDTNKYLFRLIDSKRNALPKDFNDTRFMQNCMAVLQDTQNIEKCDPVSVARTLLKGAFLGLDFFSRECYAIPYGNTLNFQTDYKGEIKIVRKYAIRPVLDIYAKLVREGDFFEESIKDGKQVINFTPVAFNDGEIKGAFAIVMYKDGGMEYETMSSAQIEKIRIDFSKMPNGMMWKKTPGEAYKKTVLRRLTKRISIEFSAIEQKKAFDEASGMKFEEDQKKIQEVPSTFNTKENEVVDVVSEEVVEEQQEVFTPPTDVVFQPIDEDEVPDNLK